MDIYDKIDPINGRRYRDLGGGCIEYQPDIIRAHGKPEPEPKKPEPEPKRCPFRSIANDRCQREQCAFWLESACRLANLDHKPAHNTEGLKCPINRERRPCDAKCALYHRGCTITL